MRLDISEGILSIIRSSQERQSGTGNYANLAGIEYKTFLLLLQFNIWLFDCLHVEGNWLAANVLPDGKCQYCQDRVKDKSCQIFCQIWLPLQMIMIMITIMIMIMTLQSPSHELDVYGCIVRPTNCNSSKEALYKIRQNCQQINQRVLKVRSQELSHGLSQGLSPQGNPEKWVRDKNYQIISCTVTKSQSKRRCS